MASCKTNLTSPIARKPVTIQDVKSWYDIDLSRCRLKIIL
jgi:hypothetical protein